MKFALLIGINYKGIENSELKGCIDDVLRMQDMLINELKYQEKNIIILRDDIDDKELYPTKKILYDIWKNLYQINQMMMSYGFIIADMVQYVVTGHMTKNTI